MIPFAMSTEKLSMLILLIQRIDPYFTDCVGFGTAKSAKNGSEVGSEVATSTGGIDQIVRASMEDQVQSVTMPMSRAR